MNTSHHRNTLIMITAGFVPVIMGALLPFLMVQHILKSTMLLNFIAFVISISGLFLGVIGGAIYTRIQRRKRND